MVDFKGALGVAGGARFNNQDTANALSLVITVHDVSLLEWGIYGFQMPPM